MFLEPHRIIHLLIALALSFGAAAMAQNAAPQAAGADRPPVAVSNGFARFSSPAITLIAGQATLANSNSLAGGMTPSGSAVRRITIEAIF